MSEAPPADDIDLGAEYRRVRQRLTDLLDDLSADDWDRPVAACPGWSLHDVVAHLCGTVEDALAGRLTGPPSEEMTAEQVARHADDPGPDLLARWDELAPPFEDVVGQARIWPAVIDVVTHEQDLRTALARPGERDDPLLALIARLLVERVSAPWALEADIDGLGTVVAEAEGPRHSLRTTPFEVVRLGLGRRSPDQVRALAWDPAPPEELSPLFIFGPRTEPLDETVTTA